MINTKQRAHLHELMDLPETSESELFETYKDINKVNKLLGGNQITLDGIIELTKHLPKNQQVTITDIGCGDGEILFNCEQYARKHLLNWNLTGIDNNPKSISIALKNAPKNSRVSFQVMDVLSKSFMEKTSDIFLFSLTLHHFSDSEIIRILETANQQATMGIVINDLQRSSIAYRLFQLFGFFFLKTKMAKNDGLISILRGFKKQELQHFAQNLPNTHHLIHHKWAFRWQWIIKNYER